GLLSGIVGHDQDTMTNDEVLKPKRNRVTRMFSSFGFRYSTPAWVGSFVLRNSFELRHSSFIIHRRKTCSRGIEHVHGTTIVRFTEHRSKLVLGERYLAVHDGSVRCLFYSQCSTGKFRSLSHYS